MSVPIPAAPFDLPGRPKPARMRGVHPDLREAIFARSRGNCELCTRRLHPEFHAHHRKLRSQGGENDVMNLLALCGTRCHNRIHNNVEWAYETGFLVRRDSDPARQPVALHLEEWVLLLPDATYGPVPS